MKKTDYSTPECFISDIIKSLGVNPPTISHHLKVLYSAELFEKERRGKYLVAKINKKTLAVVNKLLMVIEDKK